MTWLNVFALSVLALVLWRTAVGWLRRKGWWWRGFHAERHDTGTLPRINRRKPYASRTP